MATEIEVGSKVVTLESDIDGGRYAGKVGVVEGFLRFSKYHPREVIVRFPDGRSAYFWAGRVALADADPAPSKFTAVYADSFAA